MANEVDRRRLQTRLLSAGETLFHEGDRGDDAFIVEEGALEIATNVAGERRVLDVLEAGRIVGELPIIDGRPRSATATARTDVRLTVISPQQVDQRVAEADPILRMLLLAVMRYLRSATAISRGECSGGDPEETTNGRAASSEEVASAVDLIRMDSELRAAIEERQFSLVYQPLIELASGEVAGFEALIRWQSPTRGFVFPDQFIPVAEATALIVPIGEWVVEESLRALGRFSDVGGDHLFMSVNVAGAQIASPTFFDVLTAAAKEAGVDHRRLKLEILERALLDAEVATPWVERCRELGFPVALDDFGTGYSSLAYLNSYRVETVKIDKSFVMEMDEKSTNRDICVAMVHLAAALGMTVVAEGVEGKAHVDLLREMGCAYGQGYYYSKPVPVDDALALLERAPFA